MKNYNIHEFAKFIEEIFKSIADTDYFHYLKFIETEMIFANTSNDVTADYIL